jgi:hypothetical protein
MVDKPPCGTSLAAAGCVALPTRRNDRMGQLNGKIAVITGDDKGVG